MPTYNSLTLAQQQAVDMLYRDKVNLLLNIMMAVNTSRMDPGTAPADAARLDGRYADVQNRLGLVEKEMTQVYDNTQSITPPDQPTVAAIAALSSQVDQLNQNQAVAGAVLNLADQVLTSVKSAATG